MGREPCWEPPGLSLLRPFTSISELGFLTHGKEMMVYLGSRVCPVVSAGPDTWKAPAKGAMTDLIMTLVAIVGRREGVFSTVSQGSAAPPKLRGGDEDWASASGSSWVLSVEPSG